jgi:hypothetical protein
MKKIYILSVQPDPDGPTFGRLMDPNDVMKLQDFAHNHVIEIVKDAIVAGAAGSQVAGFGATLPGGLGVTIASGRVIDTAGVSYDLEAPATVQLAPADQAHTRIDLIYATVELDAAAASQFVPFRRARTDAEIEANVDPYPPTQFNQPTELHSDVAIAVHTGVPGVNPAVPALGQGEVALWQVHVAAGQTVLGGGDFTDVRPLMKSLYQLLAQIGNFDPSTVIKKDGSVPFTGDESMGGHKLTNVGDPISPGDAVPLSTLLAQLAGLDWKMDVRAATTANIALNGAQTIDGVNVVAGNRVLVKDQTTPSQNGIYVAAAGAWARSTDADSWAELVSAVLVVDNEAAATQKSTIWKCTASAGGTLGTTAVAWSQFPVTVPLATSGVDGLMPHGDKAKLDASTNVNTANALMQRDASGDFASRDFAGRSASLSGHSQLGSGGNNASILDVAKVTDSTSTPLVYVEKQNANGGNGGVSTQCPVAGVFAGNCNNIDPTLPGVVEIVDTNPTNNTPTGNLLRLLGSSGAGTKVALRVDTFGRVFIGENLSIANLPSADPHVAGQLWRSGNDLKISTG